MPHTITMDQGWLHAVSTKRLGRRNWTRLRAPGVKRTSGRLTTRLSSSCPELFSNMAHFIISCSFARTVQIWEERKHETKASSAVGWWDLCGTLAEGRGGPLCWVRPTVFGLKPIESGHNVDGRVPANANSPTSRSRFSKNWMLYVDGLISLTHRSRDSHSHRGMIGASVPITWSPDASKCFCNRRSHPWRTQRGHKPKQRPNDW